MAYRLATLLAAAVALLAANAHALSLDDPSAPSCEAVGGLDFCHMVDYTAVVNASAGSAAALDADAREMYERMDLVLARYDCSLTYSYHNCSSCREAYRYWACAVKFPLCDADDSRVPMCVSLCEDVVRKCPYVLGFSCPEEETRDYSAETDSCNKLDRSVHPEDESRAWPGSFANGGAPRLRVAAWGLVVAACVGLGLL